jgi:hypothetical protein
MNKQKNMEVTVFNPVQQHLLKFFAFDGSEEKLLEMKAVLNCSNLSAFGTF